MLCAILTVYTVNFEEFGPISRNSEIPEKGNRKKTAKFRKIFPDFKIEIRKSLCIFGVFTETALRSRYTGKINVIGITGKFRKSRPNPENPEFRKTVFFFWFFSVRRKDTAYF
jgi:hypothetical protein